MQVKISELDEHGGVWVTVTGDERNGDTVKSATAKAAGAVRRFAADHKLGKATKITAGGSFNRAEFEFRVRYAFEETDQYKASVRRNSEQVQAELDAPYEIKFNEETPDLAARWQVWHKTHGLLCASFATEAECETYVSDALAPDAGDYEDADTAPVTMTNYMVQADAALPLVDADGNAPVVLSGDWANDTLANVIKDADSRCQMQPIHRARAVPGVALVVTKAGEYVRACQQCADYFRNVVYCQYSAAHNIRHVPALKFLDCSPIGIVPACVECAEFYAKQQGNEAP